MTVWRYGQKAAVVNSDVWVTQRQKIESSKYVAKGSKASDNNYTCTVCLNPFLFSLVLYSNYEMTYIVVGEALNSTHSRLTTLTRNF